MHHFDNNRLGASGCLKNKKGKKEKNDQSFFVGLPQSSHVPSATSHFVAQGGQRPEEEKKGFVIPPLRVLLHGTVQDLIETVCNQK
jgi:hypothetical protein